MNRKVKLLAGVALAMGVLALTVNAQILSNSTTITYLDDQYQSLGGFVAPIETLFTYASELNFPEANNAAFGIGSGGTAGAGCVGVGFGNDDGMITFNSVSGTANSWCAFWLQSSTTTARSLVLSGVPQRITFQVSTVGVLTNKTLVFGLGDSTTMSTAYESAGANDGVFFRVDAAGAGVNYFAVTKNGAAPAETTTDTGIADVLNAGSTSQLRTFAIVATSTLVQYYGCTGPNCIPALLATHSTNIPNDPLIPYFAAWSDTTTLVGGEVRWIKFSSARTNVM
jgi:hypothetical protein